jgi:hypothetical protein
MRLFRWFFRCFWAAIALTALSSVAHAENGLERFEREIKPQIEVEKFTYASAKPLGDNGFVLNDVVIVTPASEATGNKKTTVKIDKVTVEDADYERWKLKNDDDLPRFAKMKLEGVTGDDETFATLTAYGVPKAPLDIVIDYKLDPAGKVLTLNALDLTLRDQARLSLAMVMDGISEKTGEVMTAKDQGRLRTATLTIEDKGLMAKLLPAMAAAQGSTADQMVSLALMTLSGFANGQGPETLAALDAVASFIADWKATKGPLVVTLTPVKTAGFADLIRILEPNALNTVFGLKANYGGTRADAAAAGPK